MGARLNFKRLLFNTGTLVMLIGWIIAFLPHATHAKIGLGEDKHLVHIFWGALLVLLGLLGMVISSKMSGTGTRKRKKK